MSVFSNSNRDSSIVASDATSTTTCILHETVSNKFNRTSNGNIYEKDLKDIFAMLIINLKLTDHQSNNGPAVSTVSKNVKPKLSSSLNSTTSRFKINSNSKKYPFSFFLDNAIDQMNDLNLTVELSKTITRISYNFKPEISMSLINQFYKSKFLHSPADRTRNEPKSTVLLQPSPKGIAVVQSFCERVGIDTEDLPEIVKQSEYNSMELFTFEKDPFTDKILYSEYFLHVLFSSMMGPKPNVWSSMNKADDITKSSVQEIHTMKNLNNSQGSSDQKQLQSQTDNMHGFNFSDYKKSVDIRPSSDMSYKSSTHKIEENLISPYHHRYFTNPESDAHIQYYTSSVGVRLLKNKSFQIDNEKVTTVDYCINGKAMCQWLIDCTDIINHKRVLEILEILLRMNLFKPISNLNSSQVFKKEQYYRLTKHGLRICQWGKSANELGSNNLIKYKEHYLKHPLSKLTLNEIVHDPGLRFQFRKHLEKDFCSENLDCYISLKQFEKKVEVWKQSVTKESSAANFTNSLSLRNSCMSNAYQIFNTFLSNEAPFMVNIDHKLRNRTIKLMIKNKNYNPELDEIDNSIFLKTPTDDIKTELEDKIENKTESNNQEEELLKAINENFYQINNHLYYLMNADSIPKFLVNFQQ